MEFQPAQVIYFMGIGVMCALAFHFKNRAYTIAIMVLLATLFFINPFRMVAEPPSAFEGTPRITDLPPKVEGKQYQSFDDWTESEKANLKQQNKENSHEIHN